MSDNLLLGASEMRYCRNCAGPLPNRELICPHCKGADSHETQVRPQETPPETGRIYPFPWSTFGPWRTGHIVMLYGPRGSGKSSLAGMLRPDYWYSSEQTVTASTELLQRIQGRKTVGYVSAVRTLAQFQAALSTCTTQGHICLDSISRLCSIQEQLKALDLVNEWATDQPGRRAVVVAQTPGTKDKPAGFESLQHQVDAIGAIVLDSDGLRRVAIDKNRMGPLGGGYFVLDGSGVHKPTFEYAYSVEGVPGSYSLTVYPTRRAKWDAYLAELARGGPLQRGIASCASTGPYAGAWVLPHDLMDRRRFAEQHGLTWVKPKEAC